MPFAQIMMQAIQHFFSGFILLRVPFPLTAGFKAMFQRGIAEMPDLEPSYVSSISWYFLVMYGLRSFFKLLFGEMSLESREQMSLATSKYGYRFQPPPGAPQGKSDGESLAKQLRAELDNLELLPLQHVSSMDMVEKRLLGSKYPRKMLSKSSGGSGQDENGDEDVDVLLAGGGSGAANSKSSTNATSKKGKKKQ
jgi:ER membrane protein complex subunit 3